MKHRKITLLLLGTVTAFLLFIGNQSTQAKYINHNTTPTELRGTWLTYDGKHEIFAMTVKKNSIDLGRFKYTNGKLKPLDKINYSSKNKNLDIKKSKKHSYTFYKNLKTKYWLSNKKIGGKKTMISYYNKGNFVVWTKNFDGKSHNFKYNKSGYSKKVGTKGNASHFIG
ncbi:hypothetical protein GSH19_07090 [Lactobacillus sp. S2-2]|uniref:hypothetical protein n=1 Tax=Lactobacillus sp. S2-2 TaxID=2692917 RepID=UPI001F32A346|nr:hypothetical protein [Lactobacillus sp. S2-2]MCF6515908.1 hypothetical protein [Lactobacillus sp. S2-2]